MQNFQDTFETRKRSFINAFSICMTVSLRRFIFPRPNFHQESYFQCFTSIKFRKFYELTVFQ